MNELNEWGFKCDRIPIIITLEGPGCIEIGQQGYGPKNRLCGPGVFVMGNFGAGVLEFTAIPDVGFDVTNVIGLPKTKQTRYRKPHFQFYYNNLGKDRNPLEISVVFKKAPKVNDLEPDDSIFKGSKS
jgi:hypothetical protein